MPEVTAIVDKTLLQDRAYNISRSRVESLRGDLKRVTARAMSSLDWDNQGLLVLKPFEQVTPVIMLAGDITHGDAIEIATPDVAAIVHIWAFDYPSRNGVASMDELSRFSEEDRETIRTLGLILFMGDRLDMIRDRLKTVLRTDRDIEVNFVPQLEGHWVGG